MNHSKTWTAMIWVLVVTTLAVGIVVTVRVRYAETPAIIVTSPSVATIPTIHTETVPALNSAEDLESAVIAGKDACTSLLHGDSDVSTSLPLTCQHDIGKGISLMVVFGRKNISIVRDTVVLNTFFYNEFDGNEPSSQTYTDLPVIYANISLSFGNDYNFDGYDDLSVSYPGGNGPTSDTFYVYDPIRNTYVIAVEGGGIRFYPATKTMAAFDHDGNKYTYTTYMLMSGKYVLVREVVVTHDGLGDPDTEVIRELRNGKMVVVQKESASVAPLDEQDN